MHSDLGPSSCSGCSLPCMPEPSWPHPMAWRITQDFNFTNRAKVTYLSDTVAASPGSLQAPHQSSSSSTYPRLALGHLSICQAQPDPSVKEWGRESCVVPVPQEPSACLLRLSTGRESFAWSLMAQLTYTSLDVSYLQKHLPLIPVLPGANSPHICPPSPFISVFSHPWDSNPMSTWFCLIVSGQGCLLE